MQVPGGLARDDAVNGHDERGNAALRGPEPDLLEILLRYGAVVAPLADDLRVDPGFLLEHVAMAGEQRVISHVASQRRRRPSRRPPRAGRASTGRRARR